MMKSYTAYCMNEDGENMCMTREYNSKKDFINDLHGNGYKVHFVALTDKYDEESEKYNARRIAKNRAAKIRRECQKEWKRRDEEMKAAIETMATEEPAADQEPEEETAENYVAWCGMIENDVITEEHETMSEAIDEVETKYSKEEMRAAGVTFCKLLCNSGQWLECLEEKKVEEVFYFDQGRVIYDDRSGNYFRIDSEYNEVTRAFWCTMVELDDMGEISAELSAGWMTKAEVNRCTDI